MRVQVLLSTYNGERWLADQLDSVLAQTHADLVVTTRDDGSTDATPEILATYARRDPRVQWSAGENLGVARSFLQLLSTATGDLVAFCDQDDVWEQDHVERGVSALAARARPALWFSNLLVTDAGPRPIGRHDLVRRGASFSNALVENVAFGCATLLNGLAVELLRAPLPQHVVMHDAWCYLVVSALGEVVYDPSPTVQQRQHDDNAVGVGRERRYRWWRRVRKAWSADYVASYGRRPPSCGACTRTGCPRTCAASSTPSSHPALRPGCAAPSRAQRNASILPRRSVYGRSTPSAEPRHGTVAEVQPSPRRALADSPVAVPPRLRDGWCVSRCCASRSPHR